MPLAHSAHWLVDLAFLSPFVGLVIWLGVTTLRDRRRAAREEPRQSSDVSPERPEV